MKYQVFDNGKPAELPELCWNVSRFDTFEEAKEYTELWLGEFSPIASNIQLNSPLAYNSFGDTIEIREVQNTDFLEKLQNAKFMLLDCEGLSEPFCYTNWEILCYDNLKDKRICFTNRNKSAYFTAHSEILEKISDNCYQHSQFKIYLFPH